MANLDPAVEIAREFERLTEQFRMYYEDRPCKVRPNARAIARDAQLLAFTQKKSWCYFYVSFGGNDEDMVKPSKIIIEDSERFEQFADEVNDCIDNFNEKLRDEECMIYHEDYGVWIVAPIIGLLLSTSCLYNVNYNRNFSGFGEVRPRDVRLYGSRCTCGAHVPRDYLQKHRDCAVHLGHELTNIYLRFLAEYKGLLVTVRGQQATLEETRKPWIDENIRFRLKWTENGQEFEESFQNDNVLKGLLGLVRNVFNRFDRELKGTTAIVHDEEHFEWVSVELLSLRLSESGCATYHVRHLQRNADNEWIPAQNVRGEFNLCRQCARPTFVPRDEFDEHVSRHADDSGIFG